MRKTILIAICCISVLIAFGAEKRPEKWAKAIKFEGVPNFHKVDDNLYRSAQPDAEGMKNLKKFGIKTIINLRSAHSDDDEIGKLEFKTYHIKIKTWNMKDKYGVAFLKIVSDKKNYPILVHCRHGADRTGTMCAVYRIVVQGWTKKEALKEMQDGGYNFHSVWQNLIRWIKKTNMKKLKTPN